jgi:hypothetical protein
MRKFIGILMCMIMMLSCITITACASDNSTVSSESVSKTTLIMQIDNSKMKVDGKEIDVDENGTTPIILNGRTLIPIRAMIEALGGSVEWNSETQTVVLNHANDTIRLVINSKIAYFNDEQTELDVEPIILNGRTMLPVRFIAESFGFGVNWNYDDRTITVIKTIDEKNNEEVAVDTDENSVENNETEENGKVLIVYFSRTGNTQEIADTIQEAVNGEIYEIVALNPYPENYTKCTEVALEEKDNNARPEIKDLPKSLDNMTVFLSATLFGGTQHL